MKNRHLALIVIVVIVALAFALGSWRKASPLPQIRTAEDSVSNGPYAGSGLGSVSDLSAPLSASKYAGNAPDMMPPTEQEGLADFDEVARPDERLIVRAAQLAIISEDVEKSVNDFRSAITSRGGLVVTSRLTRSPAGIPQGSVTARVPVDNFDQAVQDARAAGRRVADENITGQDVTEQYVDTEARLHNLQASEQQFLTIMATAREIEEVLSVQRELERVRGQIEQAQGRMQYLERTAKLSTISVSFAADEEALPVINPVTRWRPLQELKEAAQALLKSLQKIGNLFIWIGVFAFLWLPALLILWLLRRRFKPTRPAS